MNILPSYPWKGKTIFAVFKKLSLLFFLLFAAMGSAYSQTSTEYFETESDGSTNFTDNGVVFKILSHTAASFAVKDSGGNQRGWNGTAVDRKFIDNSATRTTDASFSIKTTSNLFKVNKFWLRLEDLAGNLSGPGSVTITGKLSGVTKFSTMKTMGFTTVAEQTNGYTLIDMTNLNGQNYSNIVVDQLQITLGGGFAYGALDAFTWVKDSNIVFPEVSVPTVTTGSSSNIGATSATLSGEVTLSNGATERGIVWSTATNPTTADHKVPMGGSGAAFSSTVSSLPVGTKIYYRAYASNVYGTGYGNELTFTTNAALASTISNTSVSCHGGANGTATVVPSGGVPGYTYSWSPGGATTATATGLSVGSYTCTITDAEGNSIERQTIVSQPSAALAATISATSVSCNGGSNGTATVVPFGGTPGYTYSWAPSGGTAATASGLAPGVYTCTITDANTCQTTRSIEVTQPPMLMATSSKTDVLCSGSATGSATVTAVGGTGAYTYSWAPSGGTAATATGLTAGIYRCTITDANGCSIVQDFTISEPTVLGATTAQINATCTTGGEASVTPYGGVGGYTYLWTPSAATTATVTNLVAGNYSCLITDANGCTITKNFTIGTTNTLVAATSKTDILCAGAHTGSATVIPSGTVGPFTYVWSPSGGNSATATGLAAGNYSVLITAANGCSIIKNFTINEPPALTVTGVQQTDVSCHGGSNGTATVTAVGGTGAYTYSWAPSGGTAATASGLAAGTYTVTIRDANLCETSRSVTIAEPAAWQVVPSKTDVSCHGANNGTATVTVSGGTPGYTYSWAPSGGTAATATGLAPGDYTVTITDAKGCVTTELFTILEPSASIAVQTHTATGVTVDKASLGGDVGQSACITEKGVAYGTMSLPTIADQKKVATGFTGQFVVEVDQLAPNTTYYYRAYAIIDNTVSYGDTKSFVTVKLEQQINFPVITNKTYGEGTFTLGGTHTDRGLLVRYSTDNPKVVAIAGNKATILAAGTALITATQDGDAIHKAAAPIERQLQVEKAAQHITLVPIGVLSRDAGKVSLEATSSSGLPVVLRVEEAMIATVSGMELQVLRLGTTRLIADQAGNENYQAAATVTTPVRVEADQQAEVPILVRKGMSPNGDGENDFLYIEAIRDYPINKVTIFDKNGKVLSEIEGYDNNTKVFSGNYHQGTYYYYIDLKDGAIWKRVKGFFVIK